MSTASGSGTSRSHPGRTTIKEDFIVMVREFVDGIKPLIEGAANFVIPNLFFIVLALFAGMYAVDYFYWSKQKKKSKLEQITGKYNEITIRWDY